MRTLGRRYGISRQTIMKTIHRAAKRVMTSIDVARRFSPVWSGVLVVDGKYVCVFDRLSTKLDRRMVSDDERWRLNMQVWLCGIDSGTGDLPHDALSDEETKIDLILYFQALKKIGYTLRVLVCDGSDHIVEAVLLWRQGPTGRPSALRHSGYRQGIVVAERVRSSLRESLLEVKLKMKSDFGWHLSCLTPG